MRAVPLTLLILALLTGCASTPAEEDPSQMKLNDLQARVERLEHSVANQVALSQHADETQAALRDLQGRVDELQHTQEALIKQQRDLYADLDKRLGGRRSGGGRRGG